jgi:hypothetical protein
METGVRPKRQEGTGSQLLGATFDSGRQEFPEPEPIEVDTLDPSGWVRTIQRPV